VTRHPAREPAHPFTDPTDWRDELDDLRRILAEDGRSGPLRDEVATLLVEVGRGDRIVLALLGVSTRVGLNALDAKADGFPAQAVQLSSQALTYKVAADIAEETQ
jgi:hypothetical protein